MIKVFLIDDSHVARSMLTRILQEAGDIEVVGESGSGAGGIIMIDEAAPDVVIVEAGIAGGMDIMDIIKEIKNVNPRIKVLLCTEPNRNLIVIPASEVGAHDFIEKPYRPALVLRTVREAAGVK